MVARLIDRVALGWAGSAAATYCRPGV